MTSEKDPIDWTRVPTEQTTKFSVRLEEIGVLATNVHARAMIGKSFLAFTLTAALTLLGCIVLEVRPMVAAFGILLFSALVTGWQQLTAMGMAKILQEKVLEHNAQARTLVNLYGSPNDKETQET